MYFFLKEPKADKATPIILVYYINSKEKYFKYATGQKIEPGGWDLGSRYPKLKRGSSHEMVSTQHEKPDPPYG